MEKQEYVQHVNDTDFDTVVLKGDKPSLVDFWATWCGPCRAIAPILEEVAREYGDRINVVKVNVDDSPKTSLLHGIRSIPTLMIIKDGKVAETRVGMMPKDQLVAFVRRHLN